MVFEAPKEASAGSGLTAAQRQQVPVMRAQPGEMDVEDPTGVKRSAEEGEPSRKVRPRALCSLGSADEAEHEPRFVDEYTHEPLEPELVAEGLKKELEAFREIPVYVPMTVDDLKQTDRLVTSRLILHKKSSTVVRVRTVARDINRGDPQDAYAATPCVMADRIALAIGMQNN
jgi:hypothetical protein